MLKRIIALVGLTVSLTSNAALVTSDEHGGHPLPSGGIYLFDEIMGADLSFTHSVHFSTDGAAGSSSAATVGLELDGVSSFIGDFTISLFEGMYITGSDTAGGTLIASATGTNLSNVTVFANTNYSFVIEGLTGSTPNNVISGSLAVSAVPVPAAAWLFGSALLGLAGRKLKR